MAYLKYKADKIFTGYEILGPHKVLVCRDNGEIEEIVNANEAGEGIQIHEGILCPGLINAHCHLELSYLKGEIPERTGMIDFILGVVKRRNYPEALKLEAIELAEKEMVRNGIVAVGDICNGTDTLIQKKKGNLLYRNFIETAGFPESVAELRLENSIKIAASFRSHLGESSMIDIVPHAPYSVSGKLMEMINQQGDEFISIHNQETEDENEFLKSKTGDFLRLYDELGVDISEFEGTGTSSFQSFLQHFSGKRSMLMVHNVASSKHDLEFAKQNSEILFENMYWCICANANQYINGTIPNLEMLETYGCNIVVGTDSLASNHQLDLLAELLTIRKSYPDIGIEKLLLWCTNNGARALGLEEKLGSFERGKNPGVVVIDESLGNVRRLI